MCYIQKLLAVPLDNVNFIENLNWIRIKEIAFTSGYDEVLINKILKQMTFRCQNWG